MRRPIDWMARLEFYRNRLAALALRAMEAFPVDRFGVPVGAIRTAVGRARAGRVVGIFPEGGVAQGPDSVMCGGPIKLGACVIALRAGVPIVPVAVLGTKQLTRVRPWIPFPGRQITLWVMFGRPIHPPAGPVSRRAARLEMGERLRQEYLAVYQELCASQQVPQQHRA
jgi:1-acyl-sn-glycerol-3-phosphate acyltransferase